MIFTDSQAIITRIQDDRTGSGQAVAARIIELATDLYEQGNTVTLGWVPGHNPTGYKPKPGVKCMFLF